MWTSYDASHAQCTAIAHSANAVGGCWRRRGLLGRTFPKVPPRNLRPFSQVPPRNPVFSRVLFASYKKHLTILKRCDILTSNARKKRSRLFLTPTERERMVKALGGGEPKSLWSGAGEGAKDCSFALVVCDGDPPLRRKVRRGREDPLRNQVVPRASTS